MRILKRSYGLVVLGVCLGLIITGFNEYQSNFSENWTPATRALIEKCDRASMIHFNAEHHWIRPDVNPLLSLGDSFAMSEHVSILMTETGPKVTDNGRAKITRFGNAAVIRDGKYSYFVSEKNIAPPAEVEFGFYC